MDVLQKQINELSDKVDALHSLMSQLTDQVTDIAASQGRARAEDVSPDAGAVNLPPVAAHRVSDPAMTHKDILSDEPYLEGDKSSTTRMLSPEIQIQRLTAQLTAAYNRIAALEEQILSHRSYSS